MMPALMSFSSSPSKVCIPSSWPSDMASIRLFPSRSPSCTYSLVREVERRISQIAVRPPPCLGTRRWLTTHLKAWEKRGRTWRSSFLGKTPTMRSMVLLASIVCSVESTRWPVSDASSAIEIVSTSRISPTRITLGAWRRAARRARAKVWVSAPTSRWLIVDFTCGWRYSIGSSIVMMWMALSWLILLMMAARVVDLPEPVGAGTSTMALGSVAISLGWGGGVAGAGGPGDVHDAVALVADLVELGRDPELVHGGDLVRDHAQDDRIAAALGEHVHAEARALGQAVGEVHRARAHELVREVPLPRPEPHRDQLGRGGEERVAP